MSVAIAPSILAADFARLAAEIATVEAAGADWIHVDVMDGHFVPNIMFGPPVVRAIKAVATKPLDVHLMIADPARYLDDFVTAGAGQVTIHVEAAPHLRHSLERIRSFGVRAGVAINPSTPVAAVNDVIEQLDCLLVMSVNPGFTGQAFIPHTLAKIAEAKALIATAPQVVDIEVDGGVDVTNARALVAAGATMLVAGAPIFRSGNARAAISGLRQAVDGR